MTKQKAIKNSLDHWYLNYLYALAEEYKYISITTDDCELCFKYNSTNNSNLCEYCPIKLKTGYAYCHQTPYNNVKNIIDKIWCNDNYASKINKNTLIKTIREEIAFLETL